MLYPIHVFSDRKADGGAKRATSAPGAAATSSDKGRPKRTTSNGAPSFSFSGLKRLSQSRKLSNEIKALEGLEDTSTAAAAAAAAQGAVAATEAASSDEDDDFDGDNGHPRPDGIHDGGNGGGRGDSRDIRADAVASPAVLPTSEDDLGPAVTVISTDHDTNNDWLEPRTSASTATRPGANDSTDGGATERDEDVPASPPPPPPPEPIIPRYSNFDIIPRYSNFDIIITHFSSLPELHSAVSHGLHPAARFFVLIGVYFRLCCAQIGALGTL